MFVYNEWSNMWSMTLKVIDILTCLHVINLSERWCLQISHLCYWYIYPLLLKSYSRFLGTGFRDWCFFKFFFWNDFMYGRSLSYEREKLICWNCQKYLEARCCEAGGYSIWVVTFLVILSFLSFSSLCKHISVLAFTTLICCYLFTYFSPC